MPTFLSDPSFSVYSLLIFAVFVTGGLLVKKQDRSSILPIGIATLLLLMLWACDYMVESPREEAVRRVLTMANEANSRNWDQVFSNIDDQFKYNSLDKKAFRQKVSDAAHRFTATVTFKGFDRNNYTELPDGQIRIGFDALIFSPAAPERIPLYIEATFKKGTDGQYRMKEFTAYDYINRSPGGVKTLPGI